jgi:nucleoside-diphosphate-sugar epimerase
MAENKPRYFVTGATGFIGRHLVPSLASRGDVVALIRPGAEIPASFSNPNMALVFGSVAQLDWLPGVAGPFDAVFHLAVNWEHLDPTIDEDLIKAFIEKGMKRLVHFSSICAAGVDLSPQPVCEDGEPRFLERDFYGRYKWKAEVRIRDLAAVAGLPTTILRPTIVYGPADRTNLFPLFEPVYTGHLCLWGNGQNRIRFCYVDNLVRVAIAAAESPASGVNTYNVGDPECPTLAETCGEIARALGVSLRYQNCTQTAGRAAGFARFVTNRLNLSDSFATHFNHAKWARSMEADISRLLRDYPRLPFTPLSEALSATMHACHADGLF